MSISGLVGAPSGYCFQLPAQRRSGSLNSQSPAFSHSTICTQLPARVSGIPSLLQNTTSRRNFFPRLVNKQSLMRSPLIKCAMDASYGDAMYNQSEIFPRINVKDPYKRLGISNEASEEEIQAARNFLIRRYAGHKPSVDAIEAAHDKIIMQQFYERKRPKLQIKKKVTNVMQSRYIQAVLNRFRTPADTKFIVLTAGVFLLLGVLTVLFPTEEGPTLQVAISLVATIYFIYNRLKSKIRALLYGVGAFGLSWLLGTFLMVSIMPPIPILRGPTSFEVITSLITYVLLWVSSTYLI